MTIYVACHDQKLAREVADAIGDAGFETTSRWLLQPFGPSNAFPEADRWRFAAENFDDVRRADVLVLVAGPDRYSGGKFIEAGFAYGLGKPVVILGRRENVRCYGSHMKQVEDVAELVETLKQAGVAKLGWRLDTSPETETSKDRWYRHGSTYELKREEDVFDAAKLRKVLAELEAIYRDVRVPGEIDSFTLQPARALLGR